MAENIDYLEGSTKHNQGPLTQKKGIEQEIIFDGHELMVSEEDESILICKGMLPTILIIIVKIKFWSYVNILSCLSLLIIVNIC